MKKGKRLLYVLFVLAISICLFGCSTKKSKNKKKEKQNETTTEATTINDNSEEN